MVVVHITPTPARRHDWGQRSMFKKIVWVTDGSDSADRALELAKALAAQDSAPLLAVHSVDYLAIAPPVGPARRPRRAHGPFPAG
jgi:hypothetical protein